MAFKVRWLTDEKQVLYLYFEHGGIEDWSEYHRTVDQAWKMAKEVEHEVIAIVAAYDTPMPDGSPTLHLQGAMRNMPDNVRFSVSIVERMFEKMMIEMTAKLQLDNIHHTVNSWEALNTLLESENLPTIPADDIPPRTR